MTLITWPEISDVGHHIDLMVSFVSGRDMQALGAFMSLDAAKALYSGLGAIQMAASSTSRRVVVGVPSQECSTSKVGLGYQ